MFTIISASELDYNSVIILPRRWQSSKKTGSILQPTFSKIKSTLVSNWLSSTWRVIPATSKHFVINYWAFILHWHSKVTICLVSLVFTCLITAISGWSLLKLPLNLRASSNNSYSLFFSAIVLYEFFRAKLPLVNFKNFILASYLKLYKYIQQVNL